jgi:hypothetical protein
MGNHSADHGVPLLRKTISPQKNPQGPIFTQDHLKLRHLVNLLKEMIPVQVADLYRAGQFEHPADPAMGFIDCRYAGLARIKIPERSQILYL